MTDLIPVLVTPPVEQPVTVAAAKQHLRIDPGFEEDDELIAGLIAAAVGHLDGWTGILGRAIMRQTWRVEVPECGPMCLPMPDVISAQVVNEAGVKTDIPLTLTGRGWMTDLSGPGSVVFVCEMPEALLAACRVAIQMLVSHWYDNRETVGDGKAVLPMGADAIITGMRWRHF